jgi:hypothetical protein
MQDKEKSRRCALPMSVDDVPSSRKALIERLIEIINEVYLTFATAIPLISTSSTYKLCRALVTALATRWAVSVIPVIPVSHGKPRVSLFDDRRLFLYIVLTDERKSIVSVHVLNAFTLRSNH